MFKGYAQGLLLLHHHHQATRSLPLQCGLYLVEFRVFVVLLDLVLVVDLFQIDALLEQIALFEHPYNHHSPMDRFVALVEELEGMEWGLNCPFQLEAMTIPPHGFGECAPDPRLESLGH